MPPKIASAVFSRAGEGGLGLTTTMNLDRTLETLHYLHLCRLDFARTARRLGITMDEARAAYACDLAHAREIFTAVWTGVVRNCLHQASVPMDKWEAELYWKSSGIFCPDRLSQHPYEE